MHRNKHFLLALLSLIGVMNFADRQILAILAESIKEELSLADSEVGLLTGLYFALFYAFFGIPIALLADRWHRGRIIAVSVALWSTMTLISGYATTYLHLALARIGVGLGEAGVAPASHSLITQRFEPQERPMAFTIYAVGGTMGVLIALGGGGWINQHFGWRMAFIVAGLPGLVLALVAWIFIHEPRQSAMTDGSEHRSVSAHGGILASFRLLWKMKSWRHAAIATTIAHLGTFGVGQFTPPLLARSYGLESGEIGLILALVIGVGGSVGAMSGGYLAGRVSAKAGISWLAWIPGLAFAMAGLLVTAALSQTTLPALLTLLAPYFFLALVSSGLQFAVTQPIVPDNMRATSSALMIFSINLVGMGFGPLIVGQVSDMLKPELGGDSLRFAMMTMAPFMLWGAFHYYLAGRYLPGDVARQTEASG